MVESVLQYVQACSEKAKVLQSLKESSTTNGPEGTVSNKCLKSLELLKTLSAPSKPTFRTCHYFPATK